jgi:hypothetical protein
MPKARKPEQSIELLPRAVLAIGITGHRILDGANPNTAIIAATFNTLFANLSGALQRAAQQEAQFFANTAPVLRTFCMAAEGADLLGAQAAQAAGSGVVYVLPFSFDEYQRDFSSPIAASAARSMLEDADAQLVLPGERTEGARSYERANEIILANIDLIVALWDGKRASGRAGTGDVVQSAISRGIPVIVIDPNLPAEPTLLIAPDEEELENPNAIDLPRKPLEPKLSRLVSQILSPPSGKSARRHLVEMLEERNNHRHIRFEYPLLLKLFGVAGRTKAITIAARPDTYDRLMLSTNHPSHDLAPPHAGLSRDLDRIDGFANYYGRLYRSSITSEFLLSIIAALFSALAFIFFPFIAGLSVIAQVLVNALILLDSMTRTTQRWKERWLDYRVIAERFRCVRFLHRMELALSQRPPPFSCHHDSWVEWYVRRYERALDPPRGTIDAGDIARFAEQLAETEIPDQLNYHRANFRELSALDRRLSSAARFALGSTIVVAGVYGIWVYYIGSIHPSWTPIAVLLFFVLPAMAAAFNGIRAAAELVLFAERSAVMVTALTKLRRVIRSTPMNYDRVAVAALRSAGLMSNELGEWRFMLENRQARGQHSRISKRRWFSLHRYRKANSATQ